MRGIPLSAEHRECRRLRAERQELRADWEGSKSYATAAREDKFHQ
jgi:hypothetical protein